jgi:hypothetical protein
MPILYYYCNIFTIMFSIETDLIGVFIKFFKNNKIVREKNLACKTHVQATSLQKTVYINSVKVVDIWARFFKLFT